jgi:tetratricopeptide (TPR) repeat protein
MPSFPLLGRGFHMRLIAAAAVLLAIPMTASLVYADQALTANSSLTVLLAHVATTVRPTGHIVIGSSVEVPYRSDGPINQFGEVVTIFAVDAKKGDRIAVILAGGDMQVTGPDGRSVISSSVNSETHVSNAEFTADVTGEYRIAARVIREWAPGKLQVLNKAQGEAIMADVRARGERQRADREARIADSIKRGDQLLSSGANEAAEKAYEEAIALDSLNVRANLGAGLAAYRRGNYITAEIMFSSVLSLDPSNQVAITTVAAMRAAEAAKQREADLAYEQELRERKQENEQALSNALGGFVAGLNAGVAIENAKAQAQAQAQAQARAQAAAESHYSSPAPAPTPVSSAPVAPSNSRPVSAGGGPCARIVPTGHSFPVGTSGKYERYDYRLENSCGVSVVFTIAFFDGSTRDAGAVSSRNWFCTVGFLGNPDCVGGVDLGRSSYR